MTKSNEKLSVGILGATGAVGQRFVELLEEHPWFEVAALAASERSAGKPYRKAAQWIGSTLIPDVFADAEVRPATPDALDDCDFVFSGLDSSVAGEIEERFARAGFPVISNAKNYRMHDDVPLLIPEVNPDHRALIDQQDWGAEGGYIVTNPNCSTVGLICALHPLQESFGIESVQVTTLQALSGAGYPGVSSLDALGNVVPYIGGEEEKMATEPRKLLGKLDGGDRVQFADMAISAQCNRVPVLDGHIECVSIKFAGDVSADAVRDAFRGFQSPVIDLPTAPDPLLHVFEEDAFPQPRRHVGRGGGMAVSIGRVRPCEVLDVKFVALSHNTVRGAAGGAILNAELLKREEYLAPRDVQSAEPATV